jgi:DNA polymerase-3 subunit delta
VIYLLHGKDSYQVRRALSAVRERLRSEDDMLDANTVVLDGAALSPEELLQHAMTVPFLAANRLVIVEGLIAALAKERGGRRKKVTADDPLGTWQALAERLGDKTAIPPTTTVVFVEGDIDDGNAAYHVFAGISETQSFEPLRRDALAAWIASRAEEMDAPMAPGAAPALADLLGNDLWAIDRELEKLRTYTAGGSISRDLVEQMTRSLASPRVFDLTDAVANGDERKALRALSALLVDGDPPPLIASMLVRQYRQLVLVKERREQGATAESAAASAGMNPRHTSLVQALNRLATSYGWAQLRAAYQRLLEADLSVKRGLQDDESALQLAVHELCALAPRAAVRRAGA